MPSTRELIIANQWLRFYYCECTTIGDSYANYFCQYEEYGEDFIDMLDGMFSFVLLDTRDKSFIAARDAIGITPLYIGWGLDGMQLFNLIFVVRHCFSPYFVELFWRWFFLDAIAC